MEKNQIVEIIFKCIEEFNTENGGHIACDLNAKFFGIDNGLDSLGLVNLIVNIEDSVNENFNIAIALADEKAMSQTRSPFGSIDKLADYILSLYLEGEKLK